MFYFPPKLVEKNLTITNSSRSVLADFLIMHHDPLFKVHMHRSMVQVSHTLATSTFSSANEDRGVLSCLSCHLSSLWKKPSPKFTAKSEIFPPFFPTHPYENINAPWHWELQSGSAVTSKMVWTLSSASPWQRTSCLLTQCKKPSTKDGTGGGCGLARGQGGGATYGVKGMGGWASCLMHSKHKPSWNAIRSQWALDARRNNCMQKSQWMSIGKWLSHTSSLAGRAAVWNAESKALNPDRRQPH